MNINKFTQKSMEAVQGCEKIAMEYGNQEIEQVHVNKVQGWAEISRELCHVGRDPAFQALRAA